MNAYFEYGKDFRSSKDFNFFLSTRPKIKKANRRNTNITVPGRNGDLLSTDDSYNNMTLEITGIIKSKNKQSIQQDINNLYNWLDKGSYVPLSFFFDSNAYYEVAFQGDFEYENTRKTGLVTTISIKFTAKPFKKARNVEMITKADKNFTINNSYNRTSYPLIKLYGSGNLTLTVNGEKYTIKNLVDNIVIDSELFTCYRQVGSQVQQAEQNILNYTFPTLVPGNNTFSITVDSGSFEKIEVWPQWRL